MKNMNEKKNFLHAATNICNVRQFEKFPFKVLNNNQFEKKNWR